MAMKLPTYNQPGWGATLNNYLRELNQRISKVEANNGNYSNGAGQVFGASAFSTGLTSTASTCLYNGVEQCSTFLLDSGLNNLSFTGEYFISQSTVEGNAFLGKLNGKEEWGSSTSLNSNQTMLLCVDEERKLQIIPFIQDNGKNNGELDYNLCRLGYITRINVDDGGENIYFTPCPNLATMDLHDKYNYIMRPTYKSNDSEKPQIAVGSYSYMMEGLNYYQHFENQDKTNTTPLQVLDGELYNIHTFAGVTTYFLIQKNENGQEVVTSKFNSQELENHINDSNKNKIFIFYVTIAGIIFVREIESYITVVDSTSLANFLVDTSINENNVLFYNYSWLKPLEFKRCGKDPFNRLRWHMASYNGISPQIVGTPIHIVDTNYYWANNYLTQIQNVDETSQSYYGLRIRPYIQLDDSGEEPAVSNEEKIEEYVVLNVSGKPTPNIEETQYKETPAKIAVNSSVDFYFNFSSEDGSIKIQNTLVHIDWSDRTVTSGRVQWSRNINDCVCTFAAANINSGETSVGLYQVTKNYVHIPGNSSCVQRIELTTLNAKTQPGIFLYNYRFAEDLHFGGTDAANSVFSIVEENNDYHLQFYGEKDYDNLSDSKYILGTIHLRNPGQDQNNLFLNSNYITLYDGEEIFHVDDKNFNYYPSNANSLLTYSVEGSLSKSYNTNQGFQELKIIIDNSTYVFSENIDGYNIDDYNPSVNGPLKFYYDENTELNIQCVKKGTILTILSAKYFYSNSTFEEISLTSSDGFLFGADAWAISGASISLNKKILVSDKVYVNSEFSVKGETSITENLKVSKTCSANEFEVTSDRRHKDIHGFFNFSGLNVIDNLPIYKYSFKTTPDKETIGIIAQDLLKVLPQLVDISDESHYKINESKLVYVCMQAIKELNSKIIKLENQVQKLRGN